MGIESRVLVYHQCASVVPFSNTEPTCFYALSGHIMDIGGGGGVRS